MNRKAHNRKEGPLDSFDADVADPFLDAVGPCLVERTVTVYIVSDFLFSQACKMYGCGVAEGSGCITAPQGDCRDDLVGLSGEFPEHCGGLFAAMRLAHYLTLTDDYCVSRQKNLIVGQFAVKTEGFPD